ncbi:MAG: hypothetical protein EBY23_12810, partial [Actinobacteria bacterium]|nr:hypothetical protein [Actinomycetota bacterium]
MQRNNGVDNHLHFFNRCALYLVARTVGIEVFQHHYVAAEFVVHCGEVAIGLWRCHLARHFIE